VKKNSFLCIVVALLVIGAQPLSAQTQNIEELQQILAELGYDGRVQVDGRVEHNFEEAVRQYQAANFLPITGQLTSEQIGTLLQDLAAQQSRAEEIMATIDPDLIPPIRTDAEELRLVNEHVREQAEEAIERGFVYRPPQYWESYNRSQVIQNVFNGEFYDYGNRSYAFAMFFNAYVVAFSRECSDYLPSGSAIYTFQQRTQVFNGFGFEVGDYVSWQDEIIVHPTLQPFYEQFRNHPASSEQLQINIVDMFRQGPTGLAAQADLLGSLFREPISDFRTFFVEEGCNSIPRHQMEYNLLAHARGNPSLQDAGLGFRGAAAVSTTPDEAALSEDDARLARDLLEELDANRRRPGDRLLDPQEVSADASRWFTVPIYLDGQTEEFQTQSGGQTITWLDVFNFYTLANAEAPGNRRFSAVVFDDDIGRRYVAAFRFGWRRHQTGIDVTSYTFMVRELACDALNAGIELSTYGGGNTGFGLLFQPHFMLTSGTPQGHCSLTQRDSVPEQIQRLEANRNTLSIAEATEMLWRATPGCGAVLDGSSASCSRGSLDDFEAAQGR